MFKWVENVVYKWVLQKFLKGAFDRMGNFLSKLFKGELGWKSVLAGVIIAVVAILQGTGVIDQATADIIFKFAEGLGIIGLRDAFTKVKANTPTTS